MSDEKRTIQRRVVRAIMEHPYRYGGLVLICVLFGWVYFSFFFIPGTSLTSAQDYDSVRNVAFQPDGTMVAVMGSGKLGIWDRSTQELLIEYVPPAPYSGGRSFAWSPDGSRLAVERFFSQNNGIKRSRVDVINPQGEVFESFEIPVGYLIDLLWMNDQQLILSQNDLARNESWVFIWKLSADVIEQEMYIEDSPYITMAFNSQHSIVAIGDGSGTVRLWDIATDTIYRTYEFKDAVSAMDWSPDGELLAIGGLYGKLHVWNVHSDMITPLPGHQDAVNGVVFHPDGQQIVTAAGSFENTKLDPEDTTVRMWALATGKSQVLMDTAWDQITAIDITSDGGMIVVGVFGVGVRLLALP